jgi:ADP-ribosylglycohydrolase
MKGTADFQSRQKGAIFGMFIGDALAMPVHWYYDRQALYGDCGHVTSYQAPKNPHPDSILWRSVYNGAADILHDQRKYWGQQGVHYHQFLKAGENTLNLKLCALQIDTIVEIGTYDSDAYLERYIDFMITPGRHRDTYVEEYHRHFFTNFANGKPPRSCGVVEKHISGIIGMIPLIVCYAENPDTARQLAFQHLRLTHLGDRMSTAGNLLVDILLPVLNGASLRDTLVDKIKRQDNPLVCFSFFHWFEEPDERVIGSRLSSACYLEDALPAIIYLALKYS